METVVKEKLTAFLTNCGLTRDYHNFLNLIFKFLSPLISLRVPE